MNGFRDEGGDENNGLNTFGLSLAESQSQRPGKGLRDQRIRFSPWNHLPDFWDQLLIIEQLISGIRNHCGGKMVVETVHERGKQLPGSVESRQQDQMILDQF